MGAAGSASKLAHRRDLVTEQRGDAMIFRDEIAALCDAHDRMMAGAREAERSAYVQRNDSGNDLIFKDNEDALVTAAAPALDGFIDDGPPFDEAQSETLAHLINELRAEWHRDHAVEIAELRGQVSALLTLLGKSNNLLYSKTADVIDLPDWRRKRRDVA
jgi:hypothetical protein